MQLDWISHMDSKKDELRASLKRFEKIVMSNNNKITDLTCAVKLLKKERLT